MGGYSKASAPRGGQLLPANDGSIGVSGTISFPGWDKLSNPMTEQQRAKRADSSAWVFSNIQAIAREFSVANLTVKQQAADGDLVDIDRHPLEQLWLRPNTFMGRAFLMQQACVNLLLSGECYIFAAPLGNTLAELWPVPSWMMSPVPDTNTFIKGYHFKARQDNDVPPLFIQPEYICYTRLPNPFDPHRGLSPLYAAMLAVDTDLAMAGWNKNFFSKDNAVPANVISLPWETSNPDYQRFKSELFEFYGGGIRKTLVTKGDVKLQAMMSAHKEMDFITSRAFSRDEIDRAFGFPGGYWTASATEANARHAKAVLIENAVWPLLVLLHEDLNSQIVQYWYGRDIVAEFDDIRPRNVELEIKVTESRKGYWTLGELRAEDNKDPLGDERDNMTVAEVQARARAGSLPGTDAGPTGSEEIGGQDVATSNNLQDTQDAPTDETPTTQPTKSTHATELHRWQTKSLKALKRNRPAAVPFESDVLPDDLLDEVHATLRTCMDAVSVKAVFQALQEPNE